MFMVLHASGLTIIPVSIIAQRAILKSNDPDQYIYPLYDCHICGNRGGPHRGSRKTKNKFISTCDPVYGWAGISVMIADPVYFLRVHSNYIDPFRKYSAMA